MALYIHYLNQITRYTINMVLKMAPERKCYWYKSHFKVMNYLNFFNLEKKVNMCFSKILEYSSIESHMLTCTCVIVFQVTEIRSRLSV